VPLSLQGALFIFISVAFSYLTLRLWPNSVPKKGEWEVGRLREDVRPACPIDMCHVEDE